jgi:hypothetical protein
MVNECNGDLSTSVRRRFTRTASTSLEASVITRRPQKLYVRLSVNGTPATTETKIFVWSVLAKALIGLNILDKEFEAERTAAIESKGVTEFSGVGRGGRLCSTSLRPHLRRRLAG